MKKIITFALLAILLLPACSKNSEKEEVKDLENNSSEIVSEPSESPEKETEVEEKPEDSKEIGRVECDKITTGMTKEDVTNLLGEPVSTIENETAGMKFDHWSYQKGLYFGPNCTILFKDDVVNSKTFFNLQK